MATRTVKLVISDLTGQDIQPDSAYRLTIRHPNGSLQQLDVSDDDIRKLGLDGKGAFQKRRGRLPRKTS
jgi:hypothetical protein